MNKKPDVYKAVMDFQEKFRRFSGAAEKTGPQIQKSGETLLEERIEQKQKEYEHAVLSAYNRFCANAASDDSDNPVRGDCLNLMAAYNLYKAVHEAEKQFANEHTALKKDILISSLCQKAEYTSGDDFVYLKAWLYFNQNIRDLVPIFSQDERGAFYLSFVPERLAKFTLREKEIFSIIAGIRP